MSDRLRKELKQSKPFGSKQEEAGLSIVRTAGMLERATAEVLKRVELSPAQYNVLRILKGAGAAGLQCNEIAERMVTHDPDITRLLDRMEKRALVRRERSREDRRVVMVFITADGARLAEEMAQPLVQLARRQMRALKEEQMQELIESLEEIRAACEQEVPSSQAEGGGGE